MDLVYKNGLPLLQFSLLSGFNGLSHAVTTRQGGISEGPFASLNVGFHTGDVSQRVLQNRKKVLSALGWTIESVITPKQIHGNKVVLITKKFCGKGAWDNRPDLSGVDGLVTREKGILLVIKVADCYPVFLYDPENQAVGILHAGWRGTARGIIPRGIKEMVATFGTKPEHVRTGIGPGIGKCCYQVGEEVWNAFTSHRVFEDSIGKTKKSASLYLDLKKVIRQELIDCGIKEENISLAEECTSCNKELFFSHRRDKGKTGRMAALIGLKD